MDGLSRQRVRPLGPDDFLAFNQQLAQLATAGLPLEQGLRLIAEDVYRGRQAAAIGRVASDLEAGRPLGEAFDGQRRLFPPLYGRLIDAGVKTGDLPGMLLSLGRHMEWIGRLRAAAWRAAAYPLMLMVGLVLVLTFIIGVVLPNFFVAFKVLSLFSPRRKFPYWGVFGTSSPHGVTVVLVGCMAAALALMALMLVLLLVTAVWVVCRRLGWGDRLAERAALAMPLVGPAVRWSLLARWFDAVHLGLRAGMDLPSAIRLAADTIDSPALQRESERLAGALSAGQPMESAGRLKALPSMAAATMDAASQLGQLPEAVDSLCMLSRQQAEMRLASISTILSPLLIMVVGAAMVLAILIVLGPILAMFNTLRGG
jgi:general secretion pathway protein F